MSKPLIRLVAIVLLLVLTGLGCAGSTSKEEQNAVKPVRLTWWRVFDDPDSMANIFESYRAIHPNVSITYRKLRFEEYEDELIDALAEDRGPDIFTIHNSAVQKYQSKLLPLPRELEVAYLVTKGSIKKETTIDLRKEKTLRLDQLRNSFVDQVGYDVVLPDQNDNGELKEKIFALPLALDTLVLYWNRDLLNTARIPEPAKTWDEFLTHVELLTKFDAQGNILQAGGSLGTAKNVERATDILGTIMMQNGTPMIERGRVQFAGEVPDRDIPPGLEALRFYTDFANPGKEAYTWNKDQPPSLDAFASGTSAYFFGYAYHLPTIRTRAPKLNFGVAPVPQIDPLNAVTFANYWVEGVSAKTKHPDIAWDFLQYATKNTNVASFLEKTRKPTALRSLIPEQSENIDLAVFAEGVLTAKSWYKGKDPAASERALVTMIEDVVAGRQIPFDALNIAAGQVAQTIR
jgi:ABC-type glycerol-3-phosphate transport system substrate-binding protein